MLYKQCRVTIVIDVEITDWAKDLYPDWLENTAKDEAYRHIQDYGIDSCDVTVEEINKESLTLDPLLMINQVLKEYNIEKSYCNFEDDPTDFAVFLDPKDFDRVNVPELTKKLMQVVPHAKIWVTKANYKVNVKEINE